MTGSDDNPEELLRPYRKAVRVAPRKLGAVRDLGVALYRVGRLRESEALLRRALLLAPGDEVSRVALTFTLLAQGRYREGLPRYAEDVIGAGMRVPMHLDRWNGEPLADRRVIVLHDEALDDQIQFARYLPWLAEQAAHVTLFAPQQLAEIFRMSFPMVAVEVDNRTTSLPPADYWLTTVQLPGAIELGAESLYPPPYLTTQARWDNAAPGFKTGLMTKADPGGAGDDARTLPDAIAEDLSARLPGQVIDLEKPGSGTLSLSNLAAVIRELDLVVAVDGAVAHLAGAMGKPCFLLVPGFDTDWRWGRGRDDSPWYPQTRLFRSTLRGDWTEAADAVAASARALAEGDFEANVQRVATLLEEGRRTEALAAAREVAESRPHQAAAHYNLGILLDQMGETEEAEGALRQASALAPDAAPPRIALSHALLAQGRYAEAWPLRDAHAATALLDSALPRRLDYPHWSGENPAGKRIVILPQRGLSDQLQFARFVPWLLEQGAEVTALVRAGSARLLEHSFPGLDVAVMAGAVEFPDPDFWIAPSDLPAMAGVTIDTIPTAPYLATPVTWPEPPAGFKVGFIATGDTDDPLDATRIPPRAVAEDLWGRLPGTVVNLHSSQSQARDLAETAGIIQALDLIMTIDGAIGHLAGAMGKPCFLLVPGFATDWRWMRGRDDSPWYPRHRLFRGARDGDWSEAVDRLVAAAHERAEKG